MKVLVVKTSSMGDLVHTLPALTDAGRVCPGIRFDWVAEEGFADIPGLHPLVDRVVPVAVRRWRKTLHHVSTYTEIAATIGRIRERRYDFVIDAQGLIKSGLISRIACGLRCGMDRGSCKEGWASNFYQRSVAVPRGQHATERVRQLFAAVLDYEYEPERIEYGVDHSRLSESGYPKPYLVFLHASSADKKLWANREWKRLADEAGKLGYSVLLPWGNTVEYERARVLSESVHNLIVLPRLDLRSMASLLGGSAGIVGVDTGLAHLGAALSVPGITLYTATDPGLTGTRGRNQVCLVASGFSGVTANPEQQPSGLRIQRFERLTADLVLNSLRAEMSLFRGS